MPRKSRIDAAGALQYIIARGIDRGKIFQDPADKYNFLDRLAEILKSTKTGCYAWALIPNHFHLLLRTGNAPIATVMRRLLTDHGLWSNRRHRRCGQISSTGANKKPAMLFGQPGIRYKHGSAISPNEAVRYGDQLCSPERGKNCSRIRFSKVLSLGSDDILRILNFIGFL